MPYTNIVFDIDGTLVDSEAADLKTLSETIAHFLGVRIPPEELTFSSGIPGEITLKKLGIQDWRAAEIYWEQQLARIEDPISIFDGIPEVVRQLQASGFRLSLVTSRTHSQLDADFGKLELRKAFCTVVCADDTPLRKPNPDPLLKCMEWNQALPNQTLYIGDSPYDSQCAAAAGVDFLLAGWGTHDCSIPAAKVCMTPAEILDYLNNHF